MEGGSFSLLPHFFNKSHPYTTFPRCLDLTACGARPLPLALFGQFEHCSRET